MDKKRKHDLLVVIAWSVIIISLCAFGLIVFVKTQKDVVFDQKSILTDAVENDPLIGTTYDALVVKRGKPDSINTSYDLRGKSVQWCWNSYNPRCFYDNDGDKKADAYDAITH